MEAYPELLRTNIFTSQLIVSNRLQLVNIELECPVACHQHGATPIAGDAGTDRRRDVPSPSSQN